MRVRDQDGKRGEEGKDRGVQGRVELLVKYVHYAKVKNFLNVNM